MAVHGDALAFAEAVVERLEDLQDDVEVSRLMILPAEVVEVDAVWYMSSATLVELFGQVAQTARLVDAVAAVRVLAGLLQAEDGVQVQLLHALDQAVGLDQPRGRPLRREDVVHDPVAVQAVQSLRVAPVVLPVLVLAALAAAEVAQELEAAPERNRLSGQPGLHRVSDALLVRLGDGEDLRSVGACGSLHRGL